MKQYLNPDADVVHHIVNKVYEISVPGMNIPFRYKRRLRDDFRGIADSYNFILAQLDEDL